MEIKKILEEAKKYDKSFPRDALEKIPEPSLVDVLLDIEETIRHVPELYADEEDDTEKRTEFKRIITEAETRAMAILTILRNRP